MNLRFLSLIGMLALTSCANILESQNQDISFETPGARNAACFVDAGGIRYRVNPPQTVNITKSQDDMIVDCTAPGNRRQKQVIKARSSGYAYADAALGGPPALAWDYFSESVFSYPDVITVDFTSIPVKPEAMPAQNAPDIRQPEEYLKEEILPGRPVMNADRFERPFELYPREKPSVPASVRDQDKMIETGGTSSGKGDLMRAVNPAGAPSAKTAPKAETAGPAVPIPIAPGQ